MILGAEEAGLLTQVNDDKPKSAERAPFWRVRSIPLTFIVSNEQGLVNPGSPTGLLPVKQAEIDRETLKLSVV